LIKFGIMRTKIGRISAKSNRVKLCSVEINSVEINSVEINIRLPRAQEGMWLCRAGRFS
jgi:hypothetical protein